MTETREQQIAARRAISKAQSGFVTQVEDDIDYLLAELSRLRTEGQQQRQTSDKNALTGIYATFTANDHAQRADALEVQLTEARAERDRLRAALEVLVGEVDAVFDSPAYKSQLVMAYVHGQSYSGPTIDLPAARAALKGDANA